jgi:hypothetical protein
MFENEYGSPITRTAFVQAPIYSSGTKNVTVRLRAENQTSGSGGVLNATRLDITNTGDMAFTVKVQQAADISMTGIRTQLGSNITVVPKGVKTVNVTPAQPFLEIATVSNSGSARIQVSSFTRYELCGFAKDDPFYPDTLWKSIPAYE